MPPPDEEDSRGSEPPDDDVLAGELALGVLGAHARRAAQMRREQDPAFAAQVGAWERRLAPWLAAVAPARVPDYLWERLCRELGWRPAPAAPSLWSSLVLWRS
ncbi:MAG TPA: hypothetical protein VGR80_03900, partial [Steroidobacteraceae bacterium]|nr:hypothetical protein [Steroidobacteraceae bacterium]